MKIVCIADSHLIPLNMESESFIPGHFESLPETQRQCVYDGARQELWKAFRRVLTSIGDEKPDVTIGLGDITGGWQEGGYTNDSIVDLAENACASIRRVGQAYFCVGNHEIGRYSLKARKGSMTERSLVANEQIYGPLWWGIRAEDFLLVGVASPLFLYEGMNEYIREEKRKQDDAIRKIVRSHQGPWIVFAHDLSVVDWLVNRSLGDAITRLQRVVVGDAHTKTVFQWRKKRDKLAALFSGRVKMMRLIDDAVLCPSTAPIAWRGGGWLSVEIKSGECIIEVKNNPVPVSVLPNTWRKYWSWYKPLHF